MKVQGTGVYLFRPTDYVRCLVNRYLQTDLRQVCVRFRLPGIYYVAPVLGDVPGFAHVTHKFLKLRSADAGRIYIVRRVPSDAVRTSA